ncbi:MAG: ArsR/SmtB family transcription factor [Thiolinea sp.]
MDSSPNIAKIGTLLGDNTRAHMLSALMHGKALTASELASDAGVTAQTATTHLAKLEAGGLISLRKQGRHKYFSLASEEVAALLETLMGLTAGNEPHRILTGPRDARMRKSRVCYNHLAGDMGIRLYDSLVAKGHLLLSDGLPVLSQSGQQFVRDFGIDLDKLQASRSPLCRECLDWSERRSHLAGSLGRAFLSRFEALRWAKRDTGRIITFSATGEREFDNIFGA